MVKVIDSCVWIDFLSSRTPQPVRELAARSLLEESAALCEPVQFEVLRGCERKMRAGVQERMATVPMLATPPDLWRAGLDLGLKCYDHGLVLNSMDLLIAALCLHHGAVLLTFDRHFQKMAEVTELRVEWLERPA